MTPCGVQWCDNKRLEAEHIVDWMIRSWGLETLRSGGVIDVGGDPGFVATVLLQRGVPVIVVDPCWRMTGKGNRFTNLEWFDQVPGSPKFTAFRENFDDNFVARNRDIVSAASALVSLYGDEATDPCLEFAAASGKACAVVPCNECVRFFPPHNQNYDAYVQASVAKACWRGGRLQRIFLPGAPFSRVLIAQAPESFVGCSTNAPDWQQQWPVAVN